MNKIKVFSLIAAASILISSCTSYSQAAAGLAGASIGSRLGRDVGYLTGGWRFGGSSAALGSLIGAGVGAALGVGIHNGIEQNRERRTMDRARDRQDRLDRTTKGNDYDYQIGGGSNGGYAPQDSYQQEGYANTTVSNAYVSVSPLTYMDGDGDGYISKNEAVEVEAYITNTSGRDLQDVTISLEGPDSRYVTVSSPITITLRAGQKIRYTGRIYCQRAKSNRTVDVRVGVRAGSTKLNSSPLAIYLR